jgi:hypothetical protein
MPISMSRDQYEALLDYAYQRRSDAEGLLAIQRAVDDANTVRRYRLYIRWMETGGGPPSRISIGAGWPPSQQFLLTLDRPIELADVQLVLDTQARKPVYVTVTKDTRGVVGWTELESWDFNM